jgi:N-acetylmuramoyl-L-alanine amidase
MRAVHRIILHCSATPEDKHYDVATIRKWHLKRGWKDIGYHFVIYLDGSVHAGRPISQVGAHTKGHNSDTIGICYIGGVEANGKTPKDTMTDLQEIALINLIDALRKKYGKLGLHGHNEYAAKACPSFKVYEKYNWLL